MSISDQPEYAVHELLSRLPHDQTELLPALDELNSRLGYLSRTAIESVAQHFHLPLHEVYGAATFFSMWNGAAAPVEAVHLCEDGPCHAAGAADVRRTLEKAGIEVKHTSCIGQCGCGPVVTTDSQLYRRVTPSSIHAILAGEKPKPLSLADEIIGIAVEDRTHSLLRNVGKIDPKSLKEALAVGTYRALRKAITTMTSEQVVKVEAMA
jgi:NADH-quinone oxidoreductase subunit F